MNIITYRLPSRRVLRHLNSTVTSPQLDRNIILLAHRRALTCVVFLTAEHDTQGPILVGVEKKNTRVLTYRTPPLPRTHSRGADVLPREAPVRLIHLLLKKAFLTAAKAKTSW